mgnify:CR=1 FL=1
MKILLDQGVPRTCAVFLRQAGVDAVHGSEVGLSTARDDFILEEAGRQGRVVVTLDADFHSYLALSGALRPSVIRIRLEGLRGEEMSRLLQNVIHQCHTELQAGALISVQENRIRIRRLPIA